MCLLMPLATSFVLLFEWSRLLGPYAAEGLRDPELRLSVPPHPLLLQLVPKYKKRVQSRKMATVTAAGRPVEAKAQVPKKSDQTKDNEARVGKAKKAPRQPDNATNAPPGASGPHGKSKVKGRRNSPGRFVRGERRAWAATGCEVGWKGWLGG